MKEIAIIRIPMWYGRGKRGVEQSPALISASLVKSKLHSAIVDTLDISIPEIPQTDLQTAKALQLESIVKANKNLAQRVAEQLEAKRLVLCIGGDHSIGIGSVSGSLQYDSNVGLIWYDAHGDMNTESTSPTGHIHGMPVAALMGLCKSALNDIPTRHIQPDNIFWIGARSLDNGEKKLMEQKHLHVYSTDDIHQRGMKAVMEEVRELMKERHIEHLHLSFDVDAFDPKLFPATGVKVPDGLDMKDFEQFISILPSLPEMIAADIVEYNPLLDNEEHECLQKTTYFAEKLSSVIK